MGSRFDAGSPPLAQFWFCNSAILLKTADIYKANMNVVLSSIRPRAFVNFRALSTAVRYSVNGQAKDVYKLETVEKLGKVGANEVSLKFLAAPINPSDLNLAEGVYGTKPTLPAVGGNEGVAVVQEVGSSVNSLQVGDWVVPVKTPFGTWRQFANANESDVLKVPNDIPAAYASTLTINPATAHLLLREFEQLKPGDWIIQNGANSMVGLAVVQMAREMGVKTINIVRFNRPDLNRTLRLLSNLGGDVNTHEYYLNSAEFNEMLKELPPIKLALNCVGGEVATDLARVLAPNGTLVTYGGMSKEPLSIPHDLLTYKQLKLRGFWISKWYDSHTREEASVVLNHIANQVREKKLSFFYRVHDFDDFDYALQKATEPFHDRKVVLNMDFPDRFKEHDALDANKDYWHFEAPVV